MVPVQGGELQPQDDSRAGAGKFRLGYCIWGHDKDHTSYGYGSVLLRGPDDIFVDMKKTLLSALIAGVILFLLCYGGLLLAINFLPYFFVDYINPLYSSGGKRDILFYTHAFVLSLALSFFWQRFKGLFKGSFILRGVEFGVVYGLVALVPVMWITFSSLDVTFAMVFSWLFYGVCQAMVAGIVFAKVNP